MLKSKRKFRNKAQIRKILDDLRESGLSQREFARKGNIPLSTLSNWLWKSRSKVTKSELQEVIAVGTICESPSFLENEFPGGELLRIFGDCPSQDLRRAVVELRRC